MVLEKPFGNTKTVHTQTIKGVDIIAQAQSGQAISFVIGLLNKIDPSISKTEMFNFVTNS